VASKIKYKYPNFGFKKMNVQNRTENISPKQKLIKKILQKKFPEI